MDFDPLIEGDLPQRLIDRLGEVQASPSYSAGLEFELTGVAQSAELA
jgi:hypothetical protein